MTASPRLLSKVLLTNDDGFDAPGLRTLTEVAEELAEEVWIVAPNHDQSGTSHSLSLHSPLRVSQKEERKVPSLRNAGRLCGDGGPATDGVREARLDSVGH
jgi:5'-nucleotidase